MSQKINVTKIDLEPWSPPGKKDQLFTIYIEGFGEPQKTWDAALNVMGEHEAESYQAGTSQKTYWRTPKQNTGYKKQYGGPKTFKADPDKMKQELTLEVARNQSIQRQVSLKAAVEITIAMHKASIEPTDQGIEDTQYVVDKHYNHFMGLLHAQWQPPEEDHSDDEQPVEDAGDFVKINPTNFEEDLPPVENYEDLGE